MIFKCKVFECEMQYMDTAFFCGGFYVNSQNNCFKDAECFTFIQKNFKKMVWTSLFILIFGFIDVLSLANT